MSRTRTAALAASPLLVCLVQAGPAAAAVPADDLREPPLVLPAPPGGPEGATMPEVAPLRPGPVPMPRVRPRGLRPVPMPLVGPGGRASELGVPELSAPESRP